MPTASTGFSIVCGNLAHYLAQWFRVIYFGRFGQKKGFSKEPQIFDNYELVTCQGGVWDPELVVRILKHYKEVDYAFSEDDWFSASGLLHGSTFCKKPFHFLTPIDSLPVHPHAFRSVFSRCNKIYIPNRSFLLFNGRKRLKVHQDQFGKTLKAVCLPHGCNTKIFSPIEIPRDDHFTFLWMGRNESRKYIYPALIAFERICKKVDARLLIRTDWMTPNGLQLALYLQHKPELPVLFRRRIFEIVNHVVDVKKLDLSDPQNVVQTSDCPHKFLTVPYNMSDVFLCTSKAGGFEMSINEAGACGVPSLVTDFTFMNEQIVDGKNGFLIPVEGFETAEYNRIWGKISIEKLAEKMLWCARNREAVKSMGRWARDFVAEKYRWSEQAERLKQEIVD